MTKCGSCFHPKENHGIVCSGSLDCMCQKFEEPYLVEWAQEVEMYKAQNKTCERRVEYWLRRFPHLRNAKDKTLCKVYKAVWHGFWPSKNMIYDQPKYREMPIDDTITRSKRFVKARHPELQTTDDSMIRHQEAKFQAYMEMAIGQ